MPNSLTVCCDANLIVRLVTAADDGVILDLWARWRDERRTVVAPLLLRYEATNALHRLRLGRQVTDEAVSGYLEAILGLPIAYHDEVTLHARALRLARQLNRPATYDTHYLALAEMMGVAFWTADQRLYNAVHHHLPWVHFVGA